MREGSEQRRDCELTAVTRESLLLHERCRPCSRRRRWPWSDQGGEQWRWGHKAIFWRHSLGRGEGHPGEKQRPPTQQRAPTSHCGSLRLGRVKMVNVTSVLFTVRKSQI